MSPYVTNMNTLYFLGVVLTLCCALEEKEVTIETPVGTLKGSVIDVDLWGKRNTIETFLGIPYAEAPTGERRFQKPVPKAPFSEPFLAKEFGHICFALDFFPMPWERSEDCLFLNVYLPGDSNRRRQGNLPVMVWIHGGGFINGASNLYQFERLSSFGEVIIVTLNYRLAVFGFYSTEDGNSPGNYGLWDQHLAIKWVHDNIQGFGGDPERVTIFGESAGSASVIYQSLYAGNKGLFQRAIAQSGSITSSWAIVHHSGESARNLGNVLGCNTSDSSVMTDCIRYMSAIRINETINDPSNDYFNVHFPIPMGPTIDGDFVKESPWSLLNSRSSISEKDRDFFSSLDLIIGINELDGLYMLSPLTGFENPDYFDATKELFAETYMQTNIAPLFKKSVPEKLKDDLISLYMGSSEVVDPLEGRKAFTTFATDVAFAVSTVNTMFLHSKLSTKNSYLYNLFTAPTKHILPTPSWAMEANHVDEVLFIGGFPDILIDSFMQFFNSTYTPTDWEVQLSKAMMTAWTNFAKTGNPNFPTRLYPFSNVVWPTFDMETQLYLNISRDMTAETGIADHMCADRMEVWMSYVDTIIEDNERARMPHSSGEGQSCPNDRDCEP